MPRFPIHLSAVLLLSGAACASVPVPATEMTQSKVAISAAEEAGADREPQAALHLKMARDEVASAASLIDLGENAQAKLVLQRARVDAELARSLTHEARTRAAAEQARQRLDALEQGLR